MLNRTNPVLDEHSRLPRFSWPVLYGNEPPVHSFRRYPTVLDLTALGWRVNGHRCR